MIASYMFGTEITVESTADFLSFLNSCKFIQGGNSPDVINVYLSSAGGEIGCYYAIRHAIETCEIPVHIIGSGILSSAAFMLFYFTDRCFKSLMHSGYGLVHLATVELDDRDMRKPDTYTSIMKGHLDSMNEEYLKYYKKYKILSASQLKSVARGEDVTLDYDNLYKIMLKCPFGQFLKDGEEIIISES